MAATIRSWKQRFYNKTKAHLLKQGVRAIGDKFGSCAYRTPEGLACAIGCHFKPSAYRRAWEGDTVITNLAIQKAAGIPDRDDALGFALSLQDIHDRTEPQDWKTKLEKLALENGLKP